VEPSRNRETIRAVAALCIVVHRLLAVSGGIRDCDRQAIAAGIPTEVIDSRVLGWLKVGDDRPS
jgi:hypothetical protein